MDIKILLAILLALTMVSGCGGSSGSRDKGRPAKPDLRIDDSSLAEGNQGDLNNMPFVVTLSKALTSDLVVDYSTSTVTAFLDDFDVTTGSITIPAGDTQAIVNVEITGDDFFETDETFSLSLENIPSSVVGVDTMAFGTIRTDDLPPVLIGPVDMTEGDNGNTVFLFPVGLGGITNEISVDYNTADFTATSADNDYVATSGTLTIPAGEILATVEVEVVGDTLPESAEIFVVQLSNLQGDAELLAGFDQAQGLILDDDTPIVIDPAVDLYCSEPGREDGPTDGVITVALNVVLQSDVVIDYQTRDLGFSQAAVAGDDYSATSGRLRITAGQTEASIRVPVLDDTLTEGTEFYAVDLTLISNNVTLRTSSATCNIFDDEYIGPPAAGLSQVTQVQEGDSGDTEVLIYAWLSEPASTVVSFDYLSRDFTALAGSDYETISGTVSFAVGETLIPIPLTIHGDTVIEAREFLHVIPGNLTGNARLFYDPDQPPAVVIETDDPFAMISIADVTRVEGDSGVTDMQFTVEIDAVAGDPVTMDYVVEDDPLAQHPAADGVDYTGASGSLSIPAGNTQATINVPIFGDVDNEYDETFRILLDNTSQNAEFDDGSASGRIVNDDTDGGWGLPEALDQTSLGVFPRVVLNSGSEAMAVWGSKWGTSFFRSRRYTPATGWEDLETITDDLDNEDLRELFIDDSGVATLFWDLGDPQAVRHLPGGGWGDYHVFNNVNINVSFTNPRLAGNSGGRLLAIWVDGAGVSNRYDLTYSWFDPLTGQWEAEDTLLADVPGLLGMAAAMNENGDAVVIWNETTLGMRAMRFDASGGGWQPVEQISRPNCCGGFEAGKRADVDIDENGNVIAVWDTTASYGTTAVGDIWASRYDVALDDWILTQIELNIVANVQAQVKMDPAGNAYVVWFQDNDITDTWSDTWEIRARRYDVAADSWEADTQVQNTGTRISRFREGNRYGALDNPSLTVDPAGNALLVWSEDINGDFVIRASRYVPSNQAPAWSPPEEISGASWPINVKPHIASDAAGNAIVVWMAGDDNTFPSSAPSEIWTNSFASP